MSIEETLRSIEARQVVGRERELEGIADLLSRSLRDAAAAYVHGPPGAGKTALLQAGRRLAELGGRAVLSVPVAEGDTSEDVRRRLMEQAGATWDGPSPHDLAALLAAIARGRGLLIVIDDYDRLGPQERLVRREILYPLPPGAAVLLAGRSLPGSVWPAERAWRSFLTTLALEDLPIASSRDLLAAQGVTDPVVQACAHELTSGRPGLLNELAGAMLGRREAAAGSDAASSGAPTPDAARSCLLEQIVHPGSRRSSWRAASAGRDVVLQAASLMPRFRRDVVAAMLGESPEQLDWSALDRLPCTAEGGGWHRLPEEVRAFVAGAVRRERPYACAMWLQRAVHELLGDVECGGPLGAAVAVEILLHPPAGPAERPVLHVESGAARIFALGPWAGPQLVGLAAAQPGGALVAVDDSGSLRGLVVRAPLADPTGRVPEAPHVRLAGFGAGDAAAAGALAPLLVQSHWGGGDLAVLGGGAAGGLLDAMRLRREDGGLWRLPGGFSPAWLRSLGRRTGRSAAQAPASSAKVAKEALQALVAGGDLAATRAGEVYAAQSGAGGAHDVRRWLIDALRSADLGQAPSLGRRLLCMYYLERCGSHEEIAERLELPRATYFRTYREALASLGSALLGAE